MYAGWLTRLDTGERYPAAISVGTNPTFDGERERRVESYVLDRDDLELYGVEVEVEFVDRLRGMVKFEGIEALIETMRDDVRRARASCSRDDAPARPRRGVVPRPRPALLRRRGARGRTRQGCGRAAWPPSALLLSSSRPPAGLLAWRTEQDAAGPALWLSLTSSGCSPTA